MKGLTEKTDNLETFCCLQSIFDCPQGFYKFVVTDKFGTGCHVSRINKLLDQQMP